jgi:hypothetical protein
VGFTQVYVAERLPIAIHAEQIAKLAEIFDVSADFIVGLEPKSNEKRNGPKSKIELVFESVSKLPRAKQQQIASVVEALVTQAVS